MARERRRGRLVVSLIAPPLCAGNTIVALGSQTHPLAAAVLGEVCATSDIPAGVVNILTGLRDELLPHFASQRPKESAADGATGDAANLGAATNP